MKKAVAEMLGKKIGYRKPAIFYNVRLSTLEERIKAVRKREMEPVQPLDSIKPMFES